MNTTPGSRLGPYEIVARIGAGGMGEVFRARDTRLDRSVAIKVLPEEFAKNAQLKLRFEREARAISQLNHPHICTLYDVGDDYLVMELLEGETLAERLSRGPLPLAEVLKYGAQIADALDRAHRAGIVHRDLKPGNVMLTKAGAKLLDFGLAKSTLQELTHDGTTVHHEKALTQEGTILGTFQYMAPEQLEAEEADARTDIFALGAVLYEMATGKRAFAGKTKTSLIAAIVGAQPQPVSELIPLSPPALDHVIHKCLEKEREDRWQSAHDIAEELKWIATIPATPASSTRASKYAVAAATLLAIVLVAMTALWMRARTIPAPTAAFAVLPPDGHWFDGHALSPDGAMIATVAHNSKNEGGIWVRDVGHIEAKRLTTGQDDIIVAWSPDSKWLAYSTDYQNGRQLRKIAVSGGTPEVIPTPVVPFVDGAAWGPDGTILFCRVFGDGLTALRQDGSDPVAVTTPDKKRRESYHGWPKFLPDGRRFLYVVHTVAEAKNEIWAGSLDSKVHKMILRADSLVGVARSHLFFVRDGVMYAQKFDAEELQLRAEPQRVVERVAFSESNMTAGAFVGSNGALLYRPVLERTVHFGWYDRTGRRLEKLFEEVDTYPRNITIDGTKVAAEKHDHSKGASDIYVIDLIRGIRTRITSGLSNNKDPAWSPAGERVYFVSDRDGPYDIYVADADGAAAPVPVWKGAQDKALLAVSPGGEALLVAEFTAERQNDLWLVPVAAPEKRRLIVGTEADESNASLSPDGRWVAYASDRSGRFEIYMRHLDGGRTTQISTSGSRGFAWSADGSEIFARTTANERVTIPLLFRGNEVVPGKATPLFTPPAPDYAIIGVREKGFAIWSVPDPGDYLTLLHYEMAPPLPE